MVVGKVAVISGMACAALAAGCAFDAGAEGDLSALDAADGAEPLGEQIQAIAGWNTSYSWNSSLPTRQMEPVSTHVCALAGISGKFRGTGEAARVFNDGKNWFIGGSSLQNGVWVEAHCFVRAAFSSPNGFTQISSVLSATGAGWVSESGRHFCVRGERKMLSGDAFTFIESLTGDMQGFGESVEILTSPSVNTRSYLVATSCVNDLTGTAVTFRAGDSSHNAVFLNTKGTRLEASDLPDFVASGNMTVEMAPAAKSLCAFTKISGKFSGGGEAVRIFLGTGADGKQHWMLSSKAGAGTSALAQARCFARDQN